jgi:Lrp/AsnC family leucine-responsive transcriptional regulator
MDDLDRKTLIALQQNGRITNVDLARQLGVAPSTMLERLRRLEEHGLVRGYRAIIDPKAIGLTLQGFVAVVLTRHDKAFIRSFEDGIQHIPNVRACYHITGRFDYLLYMAARDLAHWGELVKERIAAINGIAKLESFLVLSEIKEDQGWPVDDETPETK